MTTWVWLLALSLHLITATASAASDRLILVAGGGVGADGSPAATAKLVAPFGIDFAPDGTLYFVEMAGGERLRTIDDKGVVRTLAGTGAKGSSGDGGPGTSATVNGMHSLAVGPDGIVYLADTWSNRIRTYDPKTGIVTGFAGTGEKGFAGDDGPAERAKFGNVYCVAFDHDKENLYVADLDNRRIRTINMKTRLVRTHAGNGLRGVPAAHAVATAAPLLDPRAVAAAQGGVVYILERSGHALRMTNTGEGRIATVAGTGKPGAALGDGSALRVQFNGPKHLCIEYQGKSHAVLIADTENHRILRYVPGRNGATVEVLCGTGKKGSAIVAGDPLQSGLFQPHGVAVHPKTGAIYIADSGNNRILKIEK
jgi:DNA-binding beta-propeller fold protein YncE